MIELDIVELLNYKVIGSIIAFGIGSFIAYRTYEVTKKQKELDHVTHARSLLKEFLELNADVSEKIRIITGDVNSKKITKQNIFATTTPELIDILYENKLHDSKDPEVKKYMIDAFSLQRSTIALLNLYRYSLRDFIKQHPESIGNFEKTIIYTETMYLEDEDLSYHEEIMLFYEKLKKCRDFNNQYRLGVIIIENEMRRKNMNLAENLLEEIENKDFLEKVSFSKAVKRFTTVHFIFFTKAYSKADPDKVKQKEGIGKPFFNT